MRYRCSGLLALPLLFILLLTACAPADDIATHTVERRAFVHRVTAEGTLESAGTTAINVPPEVRGRVRLAWIATEGPVATGDLVARFDPTAMENRLRDGRLDLQKASLNLDKADLESTKTRSKFETDLRIADHELDHARAFQKTDTTAFSRQEIVESQIDEGLAIERQKHATWSRDSQSEIAGTERTLLDIQRKKAQLEIDQAQQGLEALEVRAPHAGLLTLKRNWQGEPPQVGSDLWQGQALAEIPNLDAMEAKVFVLEADAGGLEEGKRAEVTLDAYPDQVWQGAIAKVAPVAQPRFRGSPVQFFEVTLSLEKSTEIPKRPGIRLQAALFLTEAEDALVIPRQAVFTEDGQEFVYVRSDGGFTRRPVTVGARSMGLVTVDDGLAEGDRIALEPPPLPDSDAEDSDAEGSDAEGTETGDADARDLASTGSTVSSPRKTPAEVTTP